MNIYLRESGRDATPKSYLWLYRIGLFSYDYEPTRIEEDPNRLLTGFEGYLQT
ncbi:IS66 family transposase [Bacillus fungorum]|uniref:IS66 family transposase n=1 Tax=Bacillus fungorum TaxID=2039284 RepID=UPI003F57FFA3